MAALLLPLLLVGCLLLQLAQTESVADAPVTTFKPDPELEHILEERIEAADEDSSYEAEIERKMKKETNVTKVNKETKATKMNKEINKEKNSSNVTKASTESPTTKADITKSSTESPTTKADITKSSTESPTTKAEMTSSTSISTSQPPVITTTTEKEELVVVPLTDKPSDTSVSTEGTKPTSESSSMSPVTSSLPLSKSTSSSPESTTSSPVKKARPPWWVNKIARPIVFPLFLAISWLFLGFLLACHLAIPKLKETSGYPFIFYIVALMIKATVTFCNIVFKHHHSPEFCFYAASISYMKSLAILFWVNIMVFDIWRKSRSLVNFKPAQPMVMWKYHLYGWGTPLLLGILSLLVEHLVPDEASWIVKPGFDNGYKCWFEDDESQLLYLNTPVGILHVSNIILMVFTYRYVNRITDNAFVDDDQGAQVNTLPRDTAVPAAKRSDFISEFWFQFWILTFTVVQWVLWMIAQILQHFTGAWQLKLFPGFLIALQGVILFIIFLLNSGKRRVLKQNFPGLFERINGCWSKVHTSQNKLTINKSNPPLTDAVAEPQMTMGQTNPAFVEDVINVGQHGNIALASMNHG